MIRYALACDAGHDFESWFRGSDDFDVQAARGLVACPVCGSAHVTKQLMAPSVSRTDVERRGSVHEPLLHGRSAGGEALSDQGASQSVALMDEKQLELRAMLRDLRKHVVETSENVGKTFADEARKIHYGEAEQRSIYGEASQAEVRDLVEEGVAFHPLPLLPDDRN